MYVADDPRAKLQAATDSGGTPGAGGLPRTGPQGGPRYAPAQYARFADAPPQRVSADERTWYSRGQNFIVAYT